MIWPILRGLQRCRGLLARLLGLHTVGVRVWAEDEQGRILLVRHTYRDGWFFPGGGVDRDEHPSEAAIRELREETGGTALNDPVLMGVYHQHHMGADDIVLLYKVAAAAHPPYCDHEIAEIKWVTLDALPDGTTEATRARVREICNDLPSPGAWSLKKT